ELRRRGCARGFAGEEPGGLAGYLKRLRAGAGASARIAARGRRKPEFVRVLPRQLQAGGGTRIAEIAGGTPGRVIGRADAPVFPAAAPVPRSRFAAWSGVRRDARGRHGSFRPSYQVIEPTSDFDRPPGAGVDA